eukprot:scaffold157075_cov31-Tisochrysis_lutea.AAC.1
MQRYSSAGSALAEQETEPTNPLCRRVLTRQKSHETVTLYCRDRSSHVAALFCTILWRGGKEVITGRPQRSPLWLVGE